MRITVIVLTLLLFPIIASAQETPKVELFGGYSYFRTDDERNLHGWNGSVAVNLNKWFGLVADVSGHYDSRSVQLIDANGGFFSDQHFNRHQILVGPRVSLRKDKRLTPFAHALFGIARDHETLKSESPFLRFKSSNTGFAMALGGGLDVEITRRLALRIIQVDYSLTHMTFTQHNVRGSIGLVFRFGSTK
jgi:opacity protein-like surface antigen